MMMWKKGGKDEDEQAASKQTKEQSEIGLGLFTAAVSSESTSLMPGKNEEERRTFAVIVVKVSSMSLRNKQRPLTDNGSG